MSELYFGEWRVQIIQRPGIMTNRVFVFQRDQSGTVFLTHDGNLERRIDAIAIKEEELYFADMTDEQLHAFAQTLADRGVKTNKDSIAEGKLMATERHLEDMRNIVFGKTPLKTKGKENK